VVTSQQSLLVQQASLIHLFLKAFKRHGLTLEDILAGEEGYPTLKEVSITLRDHVPHVKESKETP
jgi:hypothetical protein